MNLSPFVHSRRTSTAHYELPDRTLYLGVMTTPFSVSATSHFIAVPQLLYQTPTPYASVFFYFFSTFSHNTILPIFKAFSSLFSLEFYRVLITQTIGFSFPCTFHHFLKKEKRIEEISSILIHLSYLFLFL